MAPVARNGRRECKRVLARMELGLVLEPDGRRDREGQRGLPDERRRQPGRLGDLYLLLDLISLLLVVRVHVVVLALEVAVDPVLLDETGDPLEAGLVRLGVHSRPVLAERLLDLRVAEAVPGRDLRGRVAGRAVHDPLRLEYGNGLACALQEDGGGDARDTGAYDGDVNLDRVGQSRVVRLRRGADPERRASPRGFTTRRHGG